MLKEAENEYNEVDLAHDAQTNPFSKDKVVKIETTAAFKRSADTIKYGEDLMFALELADEFRAEVEQYMISMEIHNKSGKGRSEEPERPRPSIHFLGRTIFDHVLLKLKAIRNCDLESTLRFLNYKQCCSLLFYLEHFIRKNQDIELALRSVLYILRSYQKQLIFDSASMHPILKSVWLHMRTHFRADKDTIGMNIAALERLTKAVAEQAQYGGFGGPDDLFAQKQPLFTELI